MSKRKKGKHRGNPAAEAQRRLEAQNRANSVENEPAPQPVVATATGFTAAPEVRAAQAQVAASDVAESSGSQKVGEDGVLRVNPAQLLEMYGTLQEENINLKADFSRVLKSYAALITNTFKLNVTMDEFDVNDPRTIERLKSKFSFFIEDLPRNCEKAGIRMPNLIGLDYTAGLNVEAMNADEFEPGAALEIDEVVEPLLTFEPKNSGAENNSVGGLLKTGLVTVKKKGE
jgi:hypothetical protein